MTASFKVHYIDVQNDLANYIWLIENTYTKDAVIIDPTEADLVIEYCQTYGLKPQQIWLTHWHKDHIAGVPQLIEAYKTLQVYAPAKELHHFPFKTIALNHKDCFKFSTLEIEVLHTPGHTIGHIVYHLPSLKTIFTGDTLFALGCGRIFEGTYAQMYESLQMLNALPLETKIYCTHEYTLSNAKFALTIEPDNFLLQERLEWIEQLRSLGQITLPTTLSLEQATNPFLRAKNLETFTHIRQLKDQY